METLIKGVLAQPTLENNVKSRFITNLLGKTAGLSELDAVVLLDLGLELKATYRNRLENQTGDSILLAISLGHRDLFWTRLHTNWFSSLVSRTITDEDYVRNIPLMISVAKKKEGQQKTVFLIAGNPLM
ncbi:hypothetical protein BGZ65_003754, partial [Modicella reniformis]